MKKACMRIEKEERDGDVYLRLEFLEDGIVKGRCLHKVTGRINNCIPNISGLDILDKSGSPKRKGQAVKEELEDKAENICYILTEVTHTPKEDCDISKSLKEFYEYAEEIEKKGIGKPQFHVQTNLDKIPWELSLAAKNTNEKLFEKYIIGRTPLETKEKSLESDGKPKTLLVTKPSQKLKEEVTEIRSEEFEAEYKNLERTVGYLNNEFGEPIKHIYCREDNWNLRDRLRRETQEEDYDFILYVGHYDPESGLSVQAGKECQPLGPEEFIEDTPVLFLDGCTSQKRLGDENVSSLNTLSRKLLREQNGVRAFIGTMCKVESIAAHTIAYHMLFHLYEDQTSLAEALHLAREDIRLDYCKDKKYCGLGELKDIITDYRDSQWRYLEECQDYMYILCGNNEETLFQVPAFSAKKAELKIVWLPVMDEYYQGFERELIGPVSTENVISTGSKEFSEIKEMLENEEMPIVADVPTLYASKLLNKENENWTIIGALFYPKKDDCGLFYPDNIEDLEGKEIKVNNEIYNVTTFLRILLEEESVSEEKIHFYESEYEQIEKNLWHDYVRDYEQSKDGYVLAGSSYFSIKQVNDLRDKEKFNFVPLFEKASNQIAEDLPKECGESFKLPGTVIVANKEEVEKNPEIYFSVLSSLKKSLEKRWDVSGKFEPKEFYNENIITISDQDKVKEITNELNEGKCDELEEKLNERGFKIPRKAKIEDHKDKWKIISENGPKYSIEKKDENISIKICIKGIPIEDIHEPVNYLDARDVISLIEYTKYLSKNNFKHIESDSRLISEPLEVEDFYPISEIPSDWTEELTNTSELKKEILKKEFIEKKGEKRGVYMEKFRKLKKEKIPDDRPVGWEELIGNIEWVAEEKIEGEIREEIEEANSKHSLNTARIKLNCYRHKAKHLLRRLLEKKEDYLEEDIEEILEDVFP